MSTLKYAVPGASAAPCEVCGQSAEMRIEIGDGFAPICSEACAQAWPKTLERINEIQRLTAERDYVQGYQADLVAIDRVLNEVDAPHDCEDGVSLSPKRIRLLAQQRDAALARAEAAERERDDAVSVLQSARGVAQEYETELDASEDEAVEQEEICDEHGDDEKSMEQAGLTRGLHRGLIAVRRIAAVLRTHDARKRGGT